jgi:hypothetical protein
MTKEDKNKQRRETAQRNRDQMSDGYMRQLIRRRNPEMSEERVSSLIEAERAILLAGRCRLEPEKARSNPYIKDYLGADKSGKDLEEKLAEWSGLAKKKTPPTEADGVAQRMDVS